MDKIKIRISSLIDGVPYLFSGEGKMTQIAGKTVLDATEYIENTEVLHHIEIADGCIEISRFAGGVTRLEFFPDKKGNIFISTEYGDFTGRTITKVFGVKKTALGTHITLSYNTDFDSVDSNIKKVQISFSNI